MSAEYGVNIDYTSLGRIHFKIELMADSHEQALKSAQDVLNIQKKWFKKHKQEALDEHKRYKTLLRHVLIIMLSNNSNNKKRNNR